MHDFAGCSWGAKLGKKKGAAARKPLTVLRLKAKARQASKLAEIRKVLIAAGYDTTAKQALALGISRSTAWVVLNRDNREPALQPSSSNGFFRHPIFRRQHDEKSNNISTRRSLADMGTTRNERGGFAVNFALPSLTTTKFERVFPHRSNERVW